MPRRYRRYQPAEVPNAVQSEVTGVARLSIVERIGAAELADMSAERISMLFDGVAKIIEASKVEKDV